MQSLTPRSSRRHAGRAVTRPVPDAAPGDQRPLQLILDFSLAGLVGRHVARLDVSETDQELDIDAELPGFDEKDVEVTLAGDTLTIRGERQNGQEDKGKNYRLSERRWGSFTRSITLPFDADPNDVDAKFEKGVLHIAIKKPPSIAAKTAKIPIKNA